MKQNSSWTAVKLLITVLLIASFAVWTYHESTYNQFVWDSYHYLVKNIGYISSFSLDNLIWMFLALDPYWHPLTWLSWAIDYQIYGGLVPSGYHLSNNILHAINSALVFVLTLVVFGLNHTGSRQYPFRNDNRALIAAFLASLLFAVHPQHVESVAWVAERKDLLCQLFLMLSLLAYVQYVRCSEDVKTLWFNCSLGLFFLALLSKAMAVTFPVILLLMDIYPLRRTSLIGPLMGSIRQQSYYVLLREKLPFFLLSVFLVLVTLLAHVNTVSSISFDLRLLNAFNSIILYLSKFLVPLDFAPLYPYMVEQGEAINWQAFIPLVGVLVITIACLIAWSREHPAWLIAWLFYLVALSPVLGLIQSGEQGAADRFAYFPTLPFYLLVGAGVLSVLDSANSVRKALLLLSIFLLVFLLSDKTRQQIHVWKTPHTLWNEAVKYNPTNATAHYNLAITFLRQHNYEKAAFHFDRSVKLPKNPTSAVMAYPTVAYRGLSYIYLGRYNEAIKDYKYLADALEALPNLNLNRDCIYFNSGWLYSRLGEIGKARENFGKIAPESQLWPDAGIWLDTINNGRNDTLEFRNLPKFCTSVFP